MFDWLARTFRSKETTLTIQHIKMYDLSEPVTSIQQNRVVDRRPYDEFNYIQRPYGSGADTITYQFRPSASYRYRIFGVNDPTKFKTEYSNEIKWPYSFSGKESYLVYEGEKVRPYLLKSIHSTDIWASDSYLLLIYHFLIGEITSLLSQMLDYLVTH